MRIFNLSNKYSVVCNSEATRSGFCHIAVLHCNGFEIARTKLCYINRTWEAFEYEDVLKKIVSDVFEGNEKQEFLDKIKNAGIHGEM